ncbi:hypothetical protein PLICRDRAFT_198506 [Plicaturopsis crispa FD-325 SS-3]|nr:hypothetical protein PLICRDRAFT_198506 [Plicaturopsis crispa FD-325 SS-3]
MTVIRTSEPCCSALGDVVNSSSPRRSYPDLAKSMTTASPSFKPTTKRLIALLSPIDVCPRPELNCSHINCPAARLSVQSALLEFRANFRRLLVDNGRIHPRCTVSPGGAAYRHMAANANGRRRRPLATVPESRLIGRSFARKHSQMPAD